MLSLHLLAIVLGLYLVSRYLKRRQEQNLLNAIALENGCLEPPLVPNRRPFGLDRVEQIIRADMEGRLMEEFMSHFRWIGYTMKQVFLGSPAYGTIEPANLKAIFSTNHSDWSFGPRREIALPILGDGIFTQEGAPWRHSRSILNPQFSRGRYENLQVFREPVEDLLRVLPKAGAVDLQPLFFALTLDAATAFLFGKSAKSLLATDNPGEQTFAQAFDTAQTYVLNRIRLQDMYWLVRGKKLRDACAKINTFADEIIDQSLSASETKEGQDDERYLFLKAASKAHPDRASLRGQILNILTAGRDTTACLLSWIFFVLVRHKDVMEKLRAEINAFDVKEEDITNGDLLKLHYLQNVLKEVLRLYPPVPLNTRTSTKTTILPTGGGPDGKSPVLIPKGTAVGFSIYTLHRRPDIYGMDAEIFRPERWDEDIFRKQDKATQTYGYLPFGMGNRTCLGKDFSLAEAAYVVVRILKRYPKIELPEGERLELLGVEKQTTTLTLQLMNGCKGPQVVVMKSAVIQSRPHKNTASGFNVRSFYNDHSIVFQVFYMLPHSHEVLASEVVAGIVDRPKVLKEEAFYILILCLGDTELFDGAYDSDNMDCNLRTLAAAFEMRWGKTPDK